MLAGRRMAEKLDQRLQAYIGWCASVLTTNVDSVDVTREDRDTRTSKSVEVLSD